MRIDELDEWQGVTPDMVREWLRNRGWSLHGEMPRYWEKGSRNFADSLIDGNSDDLAFVIHCEELAAGISPQEALREINPRMRAGIPSQEARDAHQGAWVGHSGGNRRNITIGLWDGPEFVRGPMRVGHPNAWSYWPVDHSGNKVRWPTDANGAML